MEMWTRVILLGLGYMVVAVGMKEFNSKCTSPSGFFQMERLSFIIGICPADEHLGWGDSNSPSVSLIQSCIGQAGAKVVFPGCSAYEDARTEVWNHRNLYKPAAIVFATSVAHVQNAVNCAVELKIGISPRSGGHSYEDYALGGRDGVLVVDLSGLNQLEYDRSSGIAKVGAGLRLGPLKLALWNAGKVTVPSGNCPSVGVAGHALGGGWGFLARKYGIMSDAIAEVQIVVSTGAVVTASANHNSDLFRALKGAGSNSFGVVTQFKFKVYDVSQPMTYFEYEFSRAAQFQAVKAYQVWGVSAAAEVSASLYQDPSGGNLFYGIHLGVSSSLHSNVETFLKNAPDPVRSYIVETDYIHTCLVTGGFKITDDPLILNLQYNYTYEKRKFKSKSILVKGAGFRDAGLRAYVHRLQSGFKNSYFIFDLFGTKSHTNNKTVRCGDGWVHRDSLYNIQMFSYWQDEPWKAAEGLKFVEDIWSSVRPYASSEAYQNYIDSEEPLSAYYGANGNLDCLKATKRKWDGQNIFNFNQSIPIH